MAIKNHSQTETLQTADLYLSAFLRAQGATIVRTESEGSKMVFLLRRERIQELARGYYQGAEVGALNFVNSIRDMKSLVHGRGEFFLSGGVPAEQRE